MIAKLVQWLAVVCLYFRKCLYLPRDFEDGDTNFIAPIMVGIISFIFALVFMCVALENRWPNEADKEKARYAVNKYAEYLLETVHRDRSLAGKPFIFNEQTIYEAYYKKSEPLIFKKD